MDDILAKKNRHLFLEEKDNQNNSFIRNINYAVENIDTIKTFNDNVNSDTMQHLLETYIEQVGTEGNNWVLRLTELGENILATTSGFNYAAVLTVNQDIAAEATVTLPEAMKYRVGTHMLLVSWNGTVCYTGEQYEEVGAFNEKSTVIKIKQDIKTGDKLEFRTVALADTASVNLALGDTVTSYAFPINSSNTERTLIERFSDFVNIKDFNAKGDGTTDDTVAWTAWKNALQSKGVGYVPAGTYLVNGSLIRVPHGCFGSMDAISNQIYSPNSQITESDSLFNSSREASYTTSGVSAPHIAIKDVCEHIDDNESLTENFIRGVGLYEELKITGRTANPVESATQNFSGVFAVTKNEAKGWIGGTSVNARYYEGNDPTDENWKNNKGCALGGISFGYGKNSHGGYCAGAEIDMLETYAGEEETPVYSNNDYRVFNRQTRALLLGVAGKQPVTDGLVIIGFDPVSYPCGCWNGITIGGSCMRINGQYGVAGTVGINLASWRSNQYGDIGIKFGTANRHIYARDGLKIASTYTVKLPTTAGTVVNRMISVDTGTNVHSDAVTTFYTIDSISSYSSVSDATFRGSIGFHAGSENMMMRSVGALTLRVDGSEEATDPARIVFDKISLRPGQSTDSSVDSISLGQANYPWANVRATTGPWASSDARKKNILEVPSDALMRAWGKVNFKIFQFKDAVEKKGSTEARLHIGVIAQEVQATFASEGLDASRYGLFGYDEWEDKYEEVRVIDVEQVLDENNEVVTPEQAHMERRLVLPAGNAYSIRYEEALALECAYQRWLGKQRDAKIEALMQRISALENNN